MKVNASINVMSDMYESGIEPLSYTIKQLPEDERPRERFLKQGAEALSSVELLAIVLAKGIKGRSALQLAQELLSRFGTLKQLADASLEELQQVKGLGPAKSVQIKAAVALGFKVATQDTPARVRIQTPQQAYDLIKENLMEAKREHFVVILLDTKSALIRVETISIGTLSTTLVHPREVFHPAVRHAAASLILAHNHPSGDPTPSKQDVELTKLLISSGKVMGISVNDHVIVGRNSYVSLRNEGISF